MTTLKCLEKAIDDKAYERAMKKCDKNKSIKSWKRMGRKLQEYIKNERTMIIDHIVGL